MPSTNYATVNGQLVGETGPNGTMYYDTDALGSVTMTVDEDANVLNTYRYAPYGAQISKTGSAPDPKYTWVGSLGYRTTQRPHSEYYVRARHYGQGEGSWTTVDLLWPEELPFCYLGGSPVIATDAAGLRPCGSVCCTLMSLACSGFGLPLVCCNDVSNAYAIHCLAACGNPCPDPVVPPAVCISRGRQELFNAVGPCKAFGKPLVRDVVDDPTCEKGQHITFRYCCGGSPWVYSIFICPCLITPAPGSPCPPAMEANTCRNAGYHPARIRFRC